MPKFAPNCQNDKEQYFLSSYLTGYTVFKPRKCQTFESTGLFDIPYLDKFVHFGLYFLFMGVIILEHRKKFDNTRKLILIALIPIFFRKSY